MVHAQPSEDLRGLMRVVLGNLQKPEHQNSNYTYKRFETRSELNSDGSVKDRHTSLVQREFRNGRAYVMQLERDGKPLPGGALPGPDAKEDQSWLSEFPEALEFKRAGEETIAGRTAWVLECSPRAGYKARSLRARVFEKTRGKVWIDAADLQLVRVDAAVFDTVSIGWGIAAKIQKGTRFRIDRRKIADGAWLPESQTIRFAARVMMVKSLAMEDSARFSDYRKPQTSR